MRPVQPLNVSKGDEIGARLMLEPTGLFVHKFGLQRMSNLGSETANATRASLRTS